MVKRTNEQRIKKISPPLSGLGIGLSIWLLISLCITAYPTHVYAQESSKKNNTIPLFKDFQDRIYTSIKPTDIMLGEKITITIKGENLTPSLEKIDWSTIKQHFVINDIDVGFNRIKVRLYPLSTGTFQLEEQQAGIIKLPKTTLNVQPNPNVSIQWQQPNHMLYAHQTSYWKATVWVKNSANKIAFKPQNNAAMPKVTLHVQPLGIPASPNQATRSGKTETFIASYEINTSNQTIQPITLYSPMVVIKNPSNQRWYFFDHSLTASVQPLPNFLPATVAVGQLNWAQNPLSFLQTTGQLNHWEIQLTGQDIPPPYMKHLAYQLVQYIPDTTNIEWLSESQKLTSQLTPNGLQTTLKLQLPYRTTQSGWVHFPPLMLNYFHPDTGKLYTLTLPEHTSLSLPNWLIWIGIWIIFLCTLALIFNLLQCLKKTWLRRQLTQAIQQANNPKALWQTLIHWQQQMTQNTQPTPSLKQWYTQLLQTHTNSHLVKQLVQQLNTQLYAPHNPTKEQWETLKQTAVKWSRQMKQKSKTPCMFNLYGALQNRKKKRNRQTGE